MKNITEKIRSLFKMCFGIEVIEQDMNWVLHVICAACYSLLSRFEKHQTKDKLKIRKPAIWEKPLDKNYCYYFMTNVWDKMRTEKIVYASVSSVQHP